MKFKLGWQKTAQIVFALTVLLLSIILVVFATREAEREKLIREKEIREGFRWMAESVIGQIESYISDLESRINQKTQSLSLLAHQEPPIYLIDQMAKEKNISGEIFLIDEEDRIYIPHFQPLYSLSVYNQNKTLKQNTLENHSLFQQAESLEFIQQDYSRAIQTYQGILSSTSQKPEKAVSLNGIGRCLLKQNRSRKALSIYQRIAENHPDVIDESGVPFGLISRLQSGKILLDLGQKEESSSVLIKLYSSLLEPKWKLNKAQFQFYREKIREMIQFGFKESQSQDWCQGLKKEWSILSRFEENQMARMKKIELLDQKIIPQINNSEENSNPNQQGFFHFSETFEDQSYFVSYFPIQHGFRMGFLFSLKNLIEKDLSQSLKQIPRNADGHVVIKDNLNRTLFRQKTEDSGQISARASYSKQTSDHMPPLTVSIHQKLPNSAEKQFQRKRNLYVATAAAVISVLLFGGFLAIRSTAKEMKLARLQSDFVSTVSHEFRTPLMSIMYIGELLQRGRVRKESKKKEFYKTITEESKRLSRLIENTLDFSKIETDMKKYSFEDLKVDELIQDVISYFGNQISAKKINLVTEIQKDIPSLSADRDSLSRALINLLDNALKYAPQSPRIILRVFSRDKSVFFEVEDFGPGILKKEQDKVFNKFYRTDQSHDSSIKGSGIGLTIVDHTARAHGGEVRIKSEKEKGTRVTIEIPIKIKRENHG